MAHGGSKKSWGDDPLGLPLPRLRVNSDLRIVLTAFALKEQYIEQKVHGEKLPYRLE